MRVTRTLAALFLIACGGAETESEPPSLAPVPDTAARVQPAEADAPPSSPEEVARDPLVAADDFLLEWARGSGAVFVDRVTLRGDGQLTWIRPMPGEMVMRVLEVRVSAAEVGAVRAAAARASYFALDAEYVDPAISDGSQLTLRVRAGGRSHRVRCDNRFPEGVRGIERAVGALLTDARLTALESAPEAQPEDFDPSLLAE